MTKFQRRRLRIISQLAIYLILCVVIYDRSGILDSAERWLYDRRARYCQFHRPPPTTQLVHVDIDDQALEAVGAWPWQRTIVARMCDELHRAGAKLIAMDVLFPEPQATEYVPGANSAKIIDNDAEFTAALRRDSPTLLSVSLTVSQSSDPALQRVQAQLVQDLEQSPRDVADALASSSSPIPFEKVNTVFLAARERAMYQRIVTDPSFVTGDFVALQSKLLPREAGTRSALFRLLEKKYRLAQAIRALMRFTRADQDQVPFLTAEEEHAPLAPFSEAAGGCGFVDYLAFSDGVVRAVPLLMRYRGRQMPQFGLMMACMYLGIDIQDPKQLRVEGNELVLTSPDHASSPIRIPLAIREVTSTKQPCALFDIPWVGGTDWQEMYGRDETGAPRQHISAAFLYDIQFKRQAILDNLATADDALRSLLYRPEINEKETGDALGAEPTGPSNLSQRTKLVTRVLSDSEEYAAVYRKKPTTQRSSSESAFLSSFDDLRTSWRLTSRLQQELSETEAELQRRVGGRAVLIGFAATGATDVVPTSLHARCPGNVVHGTIFNAILTGYLKRRAPQWINVTMIVLLGIGTAALTAFLSTWRALVGTMLLAVAFVAVNGFVLFDIFNVIIAQAGPLLAVVLVWAFCTVYQIISEVRERKRITQRFQSYVDPQLVEYVVDDPDRARLDGQVSEVTIGFTDLAGFTTLSEILRERAVPMVSQYMGKMVPCIRNNGGYVNKFLGDGIMFFFNAPRPRPDHAACAIASVFDMFDALGQFNEGLKAQNLPLFSMRAGIATGRVVVGDAGPPEACDYTALGDAVNFASRLESANKAVGTRMLIGNRTAELVADRYLLRPVGKLQVKGKRECVMVYEPLSLLSAATGEQRERVEITAAVVELFQGAQFEKCLLKIDTWDESIKLRDLYKTLAETYLQNAPPDFQGQIVLHEK
jgi:class 3 adenylate cyclase/CHASE2 domain-containing sensor protein